MPRYKHIDTSPRFLAVDLEAQLVPGTFEHALNHLLDHEIDLSGFDARFHNDEVGASAFPPAMLLKVMLLAYSRGIVCSRAIERACREHITFVALSGDTCPHFTTIASFISGLGELIGAVYKQVLLICDAHELGHTGPVRSHRRRSEQQTKEATGPQHTCRSVPSALISVALAR